MAVVNTFCALGRKKINDQVHKTCCDEGPLKEPLLRYIDASWPV